MNLTIIKQNDQFLVDSREVAVMVSRSHSELMKTIRGYVDYLGEGDFARTDFFIENNYQDIQGKKRPCFLLTKKGCDLVANKMTGEKGIQFTAAYVTKFDQMEKELTLPQKSFQIQSFEMQLIGAKYAAEMLRVDETSKVRMLEQAHKQHGVSTTHLPAYVDEEVTLSLTQLLKENGYSIGAVKVNTKLIEVGVLELKERPSGKGFTKEFKSLTESGLKFGKNLINPKSPKETQPHYYESKFNELMKLVGLDTYLVEK